MTPRCIIQLGKNGDIINLLPLLLKDSLSGPNPKLMVAAEFASLLEGVSYVEPIIYDGPVYDIGGAVEKAKSLGLEPVCCQVNGPADVVTRYTYQAAGQDCARTTSFQKEQWKILGRMDQWDELLPLVFDRRDRKREEVLLREHNLISRGKKKPVILLSLGGSSSPFQHADLLRQLVTTRFASTHRILELPKAERIYDLLALYERAQLLIATDSAPLHLAWVCRKLPVFALTNDKPILWNGSSWRPNMHWYCRYSDFPTRAMEMLWEIEQLKSHRAGKPLLHVWSEYETKRDGPHLHGDPFPIRIGMCGRDSQNVLQDSKRVPYLRDVLRMAIQRSVADDHRILLTRFAVNLALPKIMPDHPFFAYRMIETPLGLVYRPVTDLFCATREQWKKMLPDIPDLLLSEDYLWSQCLWAVFLKHGGRDETGICTKESKPPKVFTPSKTFDHNTKLCSEYMARSKIYARHPKLSDQAEVLPLDTALLPKAAYNPSICRVNGKLLMTYRYHPGAGYETQLGISELSEQFAITRTRNLEMGEGSHEDARLFSLHGEPWMSWVEAWNLRSRDNRCFVKYSQLEDWKTTRIYHTKSGGNETGRLEKNWVYFESDENLFCVYHSHPEQIILQVQGDTVINEYKTPGPWWPYGQVRGGSIVQWGEQLLRIFHSSMDNEPGAVKRRYYVGACLMKNKPPFEVVAISKKPVLYGSEIDMLKPADRKAIFHHKGSVIFPCGTVIHENRLIVSVGVNDSACALVKLKWEQLNL